MSCRRSETWRYLRRCALFQTSSSRTTTGFLLITTPHTAIRLLTPHALGTGMRMEGQGEGRVVETRRSPRTSGAVMTSSSAAT
jgi:hypothetical protein